MRMIVNGQVYAAQGFNWDTLDPQSPTTYTNTNDIVIDGKSFTNLNSGVQAGTNLKFDNCCNVTIRNCYIGSSIGIGIHIINGSCNFLIENCLFANNVSGVYVQSSEDIIIQDNQCINICGPYPRGQFVQFNTVTTSVSGECAVRRNKIENFLAESYAFDVVNIHASNGRVGAPIDVSNNLIRGGGPATSGGGILLGENSGDYNQANNNKLWNCGNYIMALGGGSNNVMTGNKGYLNRMDCSVDDWSNVGYIIWAQAAESQPFDNATFTNNSNYTNCAVPAASNGGFGNNPYYYPTVITGTIDLSEPPDKWYTQGPELALYIPIIDFPTTLIDMVTEDVLWQIRNESQQFRVEVEVGGQPPWLARPIAVSEADKSTSSTSTTINSTGSSGGTTYNWVQVSGPNTATLANETTATLSVSNMIDGVYIFRLEYTDANNIGAADWTQITKTP